MSQSNIFIEISTTNNYQEFKYPLQCIFERYRYDSDSKSYIVVDKLPVNLQQGSLVAGINPHLSASANNPRQYLLNVKIKDNDGINFEAVRWLPLSTYGTINGNDSEQLRTIYVEMIKT